MKVSPLGFIYGMADAIYISEDRRQKMQTNVLVIMTLLVFKRLLDKNGALLKSVAELVETDSETKSEKRPKSEDYRILN